MHILWCRTDICSRKLSAKISLMLDNPFPIPSLCKLNHISVCPVQISTKITCKQLIPFRESYVFFEVIPSVLGHSVNLNITQRFLLRRPVFLDYPLLVTMIYICLWKIKLRNHKKSLALCGTSLYLSINIFGLFGYGGIAFYSIFQDLKNFEYRFFLRQHFVFEAQ